MYKTFPLEKTRIITSIDAKLRQTNINTCRITTQLTYVCSSKVKILVYRTIELYHFIIHNLKFMNDHLHNGHTDVLQTIVKFFAFQIKTYGYKYHIAECGIDITILFF